MEARAQPARRPRFGAGTTLQAVLDACRDPAYGAAVVAVGIDRPGTGAQLRAQAVGIPVFTVPLEDFPTREHFDSAVIDEIERCDPDLVVLAGYMKVLGPAVVARFPIVNTHPSLLPSFPGAQRGARRSRPRGEGAPESPCTWWTKGLTPARSSRRSRWLSATATPRTASGAHSVRGAGALRAHHRSRCWRGAGPVRRRSARSGPGRWRRRRGRAAGRRTAHGERGHTDRSGGGRAAADPPRAGQRLRQVRAGRACRGVAEGRRAKSCPPARRRPRSLGSGSTSSSSAR